MIWSLLIFRGHSTRQSASIVCNNEQSDLFYSASEHRNRCWAQLTQEKLGKGFEKMQLNEQEW